MNIIEKDLYRYGRYRGGRGFLKGIRKPGFRYLFLLRKIQASGRFNPSKYLFIFLKQFYTYKYGFQIPNGTKIGEGFFIGHFGPIVINRHVVIGKNCNIAHGVTIGRISGGRKKGSPTIGDYVWMGANSVIVGNIKIGSNVLIAPLSYVNHDVPENSLVIGNPAKIIARENPTEGYINNIL